MKRFSCLSALLVGLSLTTVSAAVAAPNELPGRHVAQLDAQQSGDSAPSTGTPGTPNSDATASGTTAAPQPAVSVGTSTAPVSDTPAAAAPEPTEKPKPRPFAGSSMFIQSSMTTGTVFKGQTQDYNPTVEGSLWFLPRFAINDAFQLRGRLILSYEMTNSDTTTYKHEPQLGDTSVSLFYRRIPKLPGDILPAVAVNVGIPTSKLSQARTQIFSPGATLQLARPFEKVLGGEALLLGSLNYSHPIYRSQNAEVVNGRPPNALQCMGGNGCSDLLSGTSNPSDTLSYALLVSMEWGKWNPALYYLGASQWVYNPREVTNPVDGTQVGRPANFETTSVRQTHYFSAWLDYNFNSWFTGEIGFWNATSATTGRAHYSNPIFNPYADTRVYLGASFQLDNLVKTLQGGEKGEAGIVRAQNNKQPMWNF